MHRTSCFCGEALAADDLAALVPVALAHFDRTHPELDLREHHIREYLEAEVRLTGPTDRLAELGAVTVREVGPRVQAGTTTGVVAYVDDQLAAWCNASPRSAFPEHAGRDAHDDSTVGAMVCFVIAPPFRGHGLATRLLAAACDSFARRGFALVEAYPRENPPDDAKAYHGPLPLYLHAGFTPVATHGNVVVVQRPLPDSTVSSV